MASTLRTERRRRLAGAGHRVSNALPPSPSGHAAFPHREQTLVASCRRFTRKLSKALADPVGVAPVYRVPATLGAPKSTPCTSRTVTTSNRSYLLRDPRNQRAMRRPRRPLPSKPQPTTPGAIPSRSHRSRRRVSHSPQRQLVKSAQRSEQNCARRRSCVGLA